MKKRNSIFVGLFNSVSDSNVEMEIENRNQVENKEDKKKIVNFPFNNQKRWEKIIDTLISVQIKEFSHLQVF